MAKKKGMRWFDWLMTILVLAGGLNWGLVGAFDFNLVEWILGKIPYAVTTTYIAVGVSAVVGLGRLLYKAVF